MENTEIIQDLLRAITPLFKKVKNTTYELRVVDQRYAGQVNFFFEWGLVGRSTVSRQIKTVPRPQIQDLDALLSMLQRATTVRVTLG
ncbi:hypothetical protein FPFC_010200 [Fructobacillus pseudoficulneus]|uniref:Uncharacterized protein n=1 Tax=Fructobacillus pseudoficulneus TaxID=220714 RepID=A0A3F3GUV6_9LACO|nr:hypothetical protein [Fructobacillus pseudoficulneus]GAP02142.1 hypothetical protein FPFC_010200 [Fructobacillus pseudoficulneus]SEH35874.1 hypothetical protein SAMN05660469_0093 [Fructobacillus pseudoficulneus]